MEGKPELSIIMSSDQNPKVRERREPYMHAQSPEVGTAWQV